MIRLPRPPRWLRRAFAGDSRLSAQVIGLFSLLLVWLFAQTPLWRTLSGREFDVLTVATAPRKQELPIVIVGIDDTSFQVMNRTWPFPRSLHAKLIDSLAQAGAAAIVFDVVFDHASNEADDHALEAAIRRAGNVVLGAHLVREETYYGVAEIEQKPLKRFIDAGARVGKIKVEPDADQVVRHQPRSSDALWRVTAQLLAERLGVPADLTVAPDRLVRYLGPAGKTFPLISYEQALDAKANLPAGALQDQVVLVARTALNASALGGQLDTFPSPFTVIDGSLMPGIEIHTNLLENALTQHALRQADWRLPWLLALAACLLFGSITARRSLLWMPIGCALLGAAAIGLGWWLFGHRLIWLSTLPAALGLVLTLMLRITMVLAQERHRRQEIRGMFARYVSPKVVALLEAEPDTLTLGGSQREITVLFTDLAGFTTLVEQLPPLEVSSLLNDYFGIMTGIVLQHEGTVDKFIGDALMAFWGAPLDDPQQAQRALDCAMAMQAAEATFNAQRQAAGLAPLHTRIGIHRGMAVVGNMGSQARFSYTALGDTVNLASRIEGANKHYGTSTLVSFSVADATGHDQLRHVDRVRVKGKHIAVDLYTPCDDPALIAATDAAWFPWEAGHWAECRRHWEEIARRWPADPLAPRFLARLAQMVAEPPAVWRGEWTLDEK
ncbi:CHASE2 domain-containing protein [Chitinimonas sp.]|uniref:CHASE2 domain-containing protein n=1 Tax=Chitinimonas sp. TaxID=1934313 RepID=UPI0035B192E1